MSSSNVELSYLKSISKLSADIEKEKFTFFALKRCFDIVFSITLLIASSPILAISCVAILLESGRLVIYKQERVGKNGKVFTLYKLRTMRKDAEKNGPQWAEKNDNRVTKVGKFLRRSRIDELPQLINVLKGDMSIIGPRPERPCFTVEFEREVPGFVLRLQVKPGITGWAQVNGGYDLTPQEKLKYDLEYIENLSLKREIEILIKTVFVVLRGEGAR